MSSLERDLPRTQVLIAFNQDKRHLKFLKDTLTVAQKELNSLEGDTSHKAESMKISLRKVIRVIETEIEGISSS